MSNQPPTVHFIPAHWVELAAWNPGLIVYAREIPDLEWPENCKEPISPAIRPAA